ncbi:outer membrane biogenesis protein BamB [Stieleria varia]|uniref:Outer membrane biogenesis protein BamB n=2 Tax=Stieleria varia TaxID=2528005 RepID=A0A5C6A3V5_9BACT|nr:outer membrane biogenesis protein BamB [Stieleria varia]
MVALVGCKKKNPVTEIAAGQSGISVVETDLTDLADGWHQWRGFSGDGVAPDGEIPVTWDPASDFKWTAKIPGRGHGSPIVVGDLVVVATAVKSDDQFRMLAFDRESGQAKFDTVIHRGGFPNPNDIHPKATYANSTVAGDGKYFYLATFNNERVYVTAVDTVGEIVWQNEIGRFVSKFGYAPSPVLYKSLLIVAADNGGGGYLVGIDRISGEIAWRIARGNVDTYSSPVIANIGGRDELIITGGDQMVGYSPESGEVLWQTPCISEATCGTAVVSGNKIFASGGYPDKETVCISEGKKVWSNRTKVYEPSLVTDGVHVFAVSDDGIAYCWRAEDGQEMWKKRLGGNFSSSPLLCNGNIYVADLSGNCYVFAAKGDGYEQIAKNRLRDDCYASPAVASGRLYFRVGLGSGDSRQEELICIGEAQTNADE